MNTKKTLIITSAVSAILGVVVYANVYIPLYKSFPHLDRKVLRKAYHIAVKNAFSQNYTDAQMSDGSLIDALILDEYRKLKTS